MKIPPVNTNPIDSLSIQIRVSRKGHFQLSPQEVDKYVEEVSRRFRKALKEPLGLKRHFQLFCEGARGRNQLNLDYQTPIRGTSTSQDDMLQQDDGNAPQEIHNSFWDLPN